MDLYPYKIDLAAIWGVCPAVFWFPSQAYLFVESNDCNISDYSYHLWVGKKFMRTMVEYYNGTRRDLVIDS